MISDQRRRNREAQTVALDAANAPDNASLDWGRLRPLLDEAIDDLPEVDRDAVVLRFLEHQAFAEIGAALRISEDAARMRTERALEKLRLALARRGITSPAAALGAVVSSQPLIAAPAGLASTLAAHALAATGTGTLTAFFASLMTTKIVATAGVAALLAFTAGSYLGSSRESGPPPPPAADATPRQMQATATLRQENERLRAEIAGLNADLTKLSEAHTVLAAQRAAPPAAPIVARRSPTIGMAKWEIQTAIINNLRQLAAARDQFKLENGRFPNSIDEIVGRNHYIKVLKTVGGEDYSGLVFPDYGPLTVITPDGVTVTYDAMGPNTTKPEIPPEVQRAREVVRDLEKRVEPTVANAVAAYRAAHAGQKPPNEKALLPYFATPQEAADYVELQAARKAAGQ
jgi:hypothetical protein